MDDPFPINLRRLLFFHHASARDAAKTIGVTEHAVSAWLTGKRRPGTAALFKIAEVYDLNPAALTGDPLRFAAELAHPQRIEHAEQNITKLAAGKPVHPSGHTVLDLDRVRRRRSSGNPSRKAGTDSKEEKPDG